MYDNGALVWKTFHLFQCLCESCIHGFSCSDLAWNKDSGIFLKDGGIKQKKRQNWPYIQNIFLIQSKTIASQYVRFISWSEWVAKYINSENSDVAVDLQYVCKNWIIKEFQVLILVKLCFPWLKMTDLFLWPREIETNLERNLPRAFLKQQLHQCGKDSAASCIL